MLSGTINNLKCCICSWFSGSNFEFSKCKNALFQASFKHDQFGTSQETAWILNSTRVQAKGIQRLISCGASNFVASRGVPSSAKGCCSKHSIPAGNTIPFWADCVKICRSTLTEFGSSRVPRMIARRVGNRSKVRETVVPHRGQK